MPSGLFLHELIHIVLSAAAAAVCYFLAQKEKKKLRRELFLMGMLGALAGGFFVDLDHGIEYLLAYGLDIDLNAFFGGHMFVVLDKIYVLGHAWEWIILLGWWAKHAKHKPLKYFLVGLALGLFTHLVFDQYSNHINKFGYSIIYRIAVGFDLRAVTGP